ncbi:unnamed protein product [Ambrosiozyma monospora]|uniref:Unnamed protein product n=1 Tax=Ambrosiozyma monospora TaxID=43982 RepID=A0A9W6Z3X7_AMBMO|nr:unnamed protein product [Ambrosiozyma monospora]
MPTSVSYDPPVPTMSRKRKRSGNSTPTTTTVCMKKQKKKSTQLGATATPGSTLKVKGKTRGNGKVATKKLLKQLPIDILLTIYKYTLESHLSFYELFLYVGNDKNYDSVVRILLTNNDLQISQTSVFIVIRLKSITCNRPEIREYSCLYNSHDSRSVIRKFMRFVKENNVLFRTIEMDGLCSEDRDLLLDHSSAAVAKNIKFVGGEKLHVDQLKKFASILDVSDVVNGNPNQLQQQLQQQPAASTSSSLPFLSESSVPSYIHESISKSKGIVSQKYNQFTFTTAQLFSTLCEYGRFQNLETVTVSITSNFANMDKLNPVFQSPNFKKLVVIISTYPNLNTNSQVASYALNSLPRIQDRVVDSLHKFKTFRKTLEININGNFNIIPNSNSNPNPHQSQFQFQSHSSQSQFQSSTSTSTSFSQTPKCMLGWLHILHDFWPDIKTIRSCVFEMDPNFESSLDIVNYKLCRLMRLELCVVVVSDDDDDDDDGVGAGVLGP